MFRRPRIDHSKPPDEALLPSVGRPPSPLREATERPLRVESRVSQAIMSTKVSNGSLAASAKSSPVRAQINGTKPLKARSQANGSILSFFKRTASQDEEGLFFQDKNNDVLNQDSDATEQQVGDSHDDGLAEALRQSTTYEAIDNSARFNEDLGPTKRRKTTHSSNENCEEVANDLSKRDSLHASDYGVASKTVRACDALEEGQSKDEHVEDRQLLGERSSGPFVDGSDSEDEGIQVARPAGRRDTAFQHGRKGAKEMMPQDILNNDSAEGLEGEAVRRSETDIDGQVKIPTLSREGTSYAEADGFEDFEGMEDFDDEYEEGEEFVEKRWQHEQKAFELGDGFEGDEGGPMISTIKNEPTDNVALTEGEEPSTPLCPVCNSSLEGVSDQEASVHVNSCLDGKPTALPSTTPDSKEQKAHTPNGTEIEKNGFFTENYRRPVRPAKPGQENPFTFTPTKTNSSAFSKLMSGHAEDSAWATAAAAEHSARGKPSYQRTCPFYKILPGFFICVDAFRYGAVQGCNAYFLSHFHSDHYVGLTSTWSHGPIYCSRPTANLVRQQLRVDPRYVMDLEFEQKIEVPGTRGVYVTMIPANHCPGSSLYLFEKQITNEPTSTKTKTQRVLHCGDFRACPAHIEHPLLKPEVCNAITGKTEHQKIDVCYLDTTYLSPKYAFPSQEDVIQACADMCISLNKPRVDVSDEYEKMKQERAGGAMTKFVQRDKLPGDDTNEVIPTDSKERGALLVIVGTYSIGKERICLGIARALNTLIFAPPSKQRICAALEDPELNRRLTSDPRAAQVHMTPLFEIKAETLADYLQAYQDRFSRCVGFRPSGWNYRPPAGRFTDSPSVQAVLHSESWKSTFTMRDLVPARGSTSKAKCYGVPYSEHSSFRELTMFCCGLNIDRIIPTVNVGSAKSREKMKAWCERWATEKKKNGLFRISKSDDDGEGGGFWYPGKGTWELRTNL